MSTWAYDTKTGYPTEIRDAEAVANGWAGTRLTPAADDYTTTYTYDTWGQLLTISLRLPAQAGA